MKNRAGEVFDLTRLPDPDILTIEVLRWQDR